VVEFAANLFASFNDLLGHAVQSGPNTVITDGFGDTLAL
jgi:hypothetical protein